MSFLLVACQPTDQELPFALAPGESVNVQIGTGGGTVSLPPSFSLDVPQGALTSAVAVEVSQLLSGPFPSTAGLAVPGTAYDLQPVGTVLSEPARVEIKVAPGALGEGEDVRMSVGVARADGSVRTYSGIYDVTNGVLTAEIDELGPVAAVVTADAIAVTAGLPDALPGGSFPPPPSPVGPAPAPGDFGEFNATCSPEARQCYSSGLIRLWADEIVQRRIGEELFLVGPTVETNLAFISFDTNGIPTEITGSIAIDGDLRARFNSSVNSYSLDEGLRTGRETEPAPTSLQVTGNIMVIGETTNESTGALELDEELEFGITGIGTSEMLIIRLEADVTFTNADNSEEIGMIIADVRLRR
jgi:hypothetical protein